MSIDTIELITKAEKAGVAFMPDRYEPAFCFGINEDKGLYTRPYPDAVWKLIEFVKIFDENGSGPHNRFRSLYAMKEEVDEFEEDALRIDTMKFLWKKFSLKDRISIWSKLRPNYSKEIQKGHAKSPPIPVDKILTWKNSHELSCNLNSNEFARYISVPQYLDQNGFGRDKIIKIWDKEALE